MKSMKTVLLAAGASLSLLAVPVQAQDAAAGPDAEMMEAMRTMFPVEPLTAEEQSRLPMARSIIDTMIPPGTLGEMMGGMFDRMLGPIMEMATSNPTGDVARQLGMEASELDLGEEQAIELAGILDPAWRERNRAWRASCPS